MKPFRNLAQTRTPDGSTFSLHEHDGEYFLKLNGRQLMSTTSTTSELLLAELPCQGLRGRADTCVLIGGLGLGYSLQRVLELVGQHATVQVAELLPEVVAWNREFLRGVNGALLDDPRVEVITGDVFDVIRKAGEARYDAILLDVDNGPTSFVQPKNFRLYGGHGLGSSPARSNPSARSRSGPRAPSRTSSAGSRMPDSGPRPSRPKPMSGPSARRMSSTWPSARLPARKGRCSRAAPDPPGGAARGKRSRDNVMPALATSRQFY